VERKLTILKPFFEDPNRKFSIRELSRILKINHTTVRQYLNKLVKEGFLSPKKEGVYLFYHLILSRKTLNLKLYYNLEKVRNSNLIEELEKAYRMASLYVMPSVSEPFGITALEAIQSGTPILISRQSGVSEVIAHALKADFWDVNDLANKILAVLRYRALPAVMREHASQEITKFNWDSPAQKCMDIYRELTGR